MHTLRHLHRYSLAINKLHLFLSEIGVKSFRQHIVKLPGAAAMSDNKEKYEADIEKVFGKMKPEL
ncbi:hypothetical protein DSL62_04250 [Pantoea sp. 3_1284]|nr:hypothetical protein DSL62_04250 [Pantoea sp. 3_1284]